MALFGRKKTKKVRKLIKLEHLLENLELETIAELQRTYKNILKKEGHRYAVGRLAPEEHIKGEILYLEQTLKRFAKMSEKNIKFLKKKKETRKIATRIFWIIQAIYKVRSNLKQILGKKSRALKKDAAHLKRISTRLNQLLNQSRK